MNERADKEENTKSSILLLIAFQIICPHNINPFFSQKDEIVKRKKESWGKKEIVLLTEKMLCDFEGVH